MSQPDRLETIFTRQRELQTKSYGADPAGLTGEERITYIKDMSLALEDEVHEALGEVGWKPWASSRHVNREAYIGELVDALHFLVNLFLVEDAGPEEVLSRYLEKADKNARRQAEGYDGVSGKCPSCGRAYDDRGVLCTPIACLDGNFKAEENYVHPRTSRSGPAGPLTASRPMIGLPAPEDLVE